MSNFDRWWVIKPLAEVASYRENAVHHKVKSGPWIGDSFVVFKVRESRKHNQKGAVA